MPNSPLTIELLSDVVCPWCAVGYHSLVRAIRSLPPESNIRLRWHPFELNPDLPPGGEDLHSHLAGKHGQVDPQWQTTVRTQAAAVGFDFEWRPGQRIYNTRKAHRLLQWAGEQYQTPLADALFNAYFQRHLAIDDDATLVAIAAGIGLDGDTARTVLHDPAIENDLNAAALNWYQEGVSAVPTFIIRDKFVINGAQSVEQWLCALTRLQGGPQALAPASGRLESRQLS